jgi:hypothetical protein
MLRSLNANEHDRDKITPVSDAGAIPTRGRSALPKAQAAQRRTGGGNALASYGYRVAGPVDLRLYLAGGLGMFTILVSIIASIWIGRGLIRELGGLRSAALEVADVRLPQLGVRSARWRPGRASAGDAPGRPGGAPRSNGQPHGPGH